jgi:hypothetical protein
LSDESNDVTGKVHVAVVAVNDAPVVISPMPLNATEDMPLHVDLTAYIFDADNKLTDLKIQFNQTKYLKTLGSPLELELVYPEGVLWDSIIVSATDFLTMGYGYINVTVKPVNDPPEIDMSDITVNETETVILKPAISDVDTPLKKLTVKYSGKMTLVSWATHYDDAGVYPEQVTVSDGEHTVTKTINITVINKNRPPSVILGIGAGKSFLVTNNISFEPASLSDPDNDSMTIMWDFGDGQKAAGTHVHHKYPRAGTYDLKVTVTDRYGAAANDSVMISVKALNTTTPGFGAGAVLMAAASIAIWGFRRREG